MCTCTCIMPPCVETKATATHVMNVAITFMYRAGFWLRSGDAQKLSELLYVFLMKYTRCAYLTLQQRKRRFAMLPKGHMIAHEALRLLAESKRAPWAVNTIVFTNQLQEDYVGRPSRLSRRVNIKNLHWNVMNRMMIVYQLQLSKLRTDLRGWDAYGDL